MRIAFYAPMKPPDHPVPSGDRTLARAFLAALEQAGHTPGLACHFISRDGRGDAVRQERLRALGAALADRLAARLVGRPAPKRPEAWLTYHLYHKSPDWIGPYVCRRLSIPYLVAEASHAPKQAGGPWNIGYCGARDAIGQATRIFVMNPADRECLRPLMSVGAALVPLLPFLDPAPFAAAAAVRDDHRMALARKHQIDPADSWILAVGMMRAGDKLASYRILADVLRGLPENGWRLLVVGDGPHRNEIVSDLQQAASRRIHPLGEIGPRRLPSVYSACEMMLWPAVGEAIGMALLEAQAAGLPVVAGREGGVSSIVRDGTTGLLTAPGDATALAAAATNLLQDTALTRRMSVAARETATKEHGLATTGQVLDQALREAVAYPATP